MNPEPRLLLAPAFLVALTLLLANDFVLKQVYHNVLTGKLSDFAGLFAFALFWTALVPRRRLVIHLLTAPGFVVWKSACVDPLIAVWNESGMLPVARVADATDLLALAMLPWAYAYAGTYMNSRADEHERRSNMPQRYSLAHRCATCVIVATALFTFTATSYSDEQSVRLDQSYSFAMDRTELLRRLKQIEFIQIYNLDLLAFDENLNVESGAITVNTRFCKDELRAQINLITRSESSTIELKSIEYRCDVQDPTHEAKLLNIFERQVIEQLRK